MRTKKKTGASQGVQPALEGVTPEGQKVAETEVEAYTYIYNRLKALGWSVKNPTLGRGGNVWTQNQCLMHPVMKVAFGQCRPEYVVKISERLVWIIESKATRGELDLAVEEARDVYAGAINACAITDFKACVVSGVAGNDDAGFAVRSHVYADGRWQGITINGQLATGLLSPDNVAVLLRTGVADIHDFVPPLAYSWKQPRTSTRFYTTVALTRTTERRLLQRFCYQ